MYIAVVTLNTKHNNKLSGLSSEGFERTVIWNEHKSKIETINVTQNNNNFKRTTLDTSFQGVSRLFAAAYETGNIARNSADETQKEDNIYQVQKLKTLMS